MKADPALLRPWTKEFGRAEPHAEPSVAVFRGGGKTLVFVATLHVHGRDDASEREYAVLLAAAPRARPGPEVVLSLQARERHPSLVLGF